VRNSPMDGTAYALPDHDPTGATTGSGGQVVDEAGWPKDKRGEWVMTSCLGSAINLALDYLPILQEAVAQRWAQGHVDLIDNSLITDYLSGMALAARTMTAGASVGSGEDHENYATFRSETTNQCRRLGLPRFGGAPRFRLKVS